MTNRSPPHTKLAHALFLARLHAAITNAERFLTSERDKPSQAARLTAERARGLRKMQRLAKQGKQ